MSLQSGELNYNDIRIDVVFIETDYIIHVEWLALTSQGEIISGYLSYNWGEQ